MNKISKQEFDQAYSSLTLNQEEILLCFLENHDKTQEEIAFILGTTHGNIRTQMVNIYKAFDINYPNSWKKDYLIDLFKIYKPELVKNRPRIIKKKKINNPQQNLQDINVSSKFYGRDQNIKDIEKLILEYHYKLLILKGIYGVGKTSLAVALAKQIKDEFNFSLGISLENAPPLQKVIIKIIKFISPSEKIELPKNLSDLISKLIEYLDKYPCLIILDNLETILESGDRTGQYKEEYQDYCQLFDKIIKTRHQSCLLLTSREIPEHIALADATEEDSPVTIFPVNSLEPKYAKNIILNKGLEGSPAEFEQLAKRYEYHPLMLKLIIPTIKKLYQGKITDFLQLKITELDSINKILDWHFQRLSDAEKQVIYWLAINREFVDIKELKTDINQSLLSKNLIASLEILLDSSLIYESELGFKLQPVILEYITKNLITQAFTELTTGELQIIKSHALMKATTKDYIRETQNKLIIQPLIEKLLNYCNNKSRLESHLKEILLKLKDKHNIGYAGGNLINILATLEIDFSNYDFSDIKIVQGFLKEINLHNVNFENTHFENTVFKETLSAIFALAFSPDGQILAISDYRSTIQLIDISTRRKILTIHELSHHVFRTVTFSPDSKILASGNTNGTIQLWDVKTGECLNNIPAHSDWINSITFHPHGEILASGSSDSKIKIWKISQAEYLNINTLSEHSECVHSVAFNSQGILASGSRDKTVKIWKINKETSEQTFTEHTDSVYSVAFHPDGEILASGSGDSTVKIWDMETLNFKSRTTLEQHNNAVMTVAFSSDGKILSSGGSDTNIQIWDTENLENINHITTLQEHENWIRAIVFSPKNHLLVSGDIDSKLKLWNLEDVNNINSLTSWQGHTSEIRTVAFSPQGDILASGSSDKTVRLYHVNEDVNKNVKIAEMTNTLTGHTDIVYSIAFNSQGNTLASGSADSTILIWDVESHNYMNTLREHKNHVRYLAFSNQNQQLVSASRDCSVKLWNIDSGRCEISLEEENEYKDAIAFHPSQEILAYSIYSGDVKLYDVKNQQHLKTLSGHSTRVNSLAFHPQGDILASASNDNTIRLWNINNYKCLAILKQHNNWVRSVAFHPQGNILASASSDGNVILWDMISHEVKLELKGHSDWVYSVAFSPSGKILASGSADETIKLWDVKTGVCLQTLTIPKPYQGMNITGVTGLTPEVKATLKALGAVEFLM
jgi:WD40 repeat protein/DNA-binding CsgD family transcriptional regulator